jgi:magnesium transporter
MSAPVVDDNNILLGRITIDDVVDIIRDQAEHQVMGAAGLDEDEDLFSPVCARVRRRLVWLGINLVHRLPGGQRGRPASKAPSTRSSPSPC